MTMIERRSSLEWKQLYVAAMLESDPAKVQERIETADAAIRARLKELSGSSTTNSEEMELQAALMYLSRVKGSVDSDSSFLSQPTSPCLHLAVGMWAFFQLI